MLILLISCYFFYDHFNQNKSKFLGAVTVTSSESWVIFQKD